MPVGMPLRDREIMEKLFDLKKLTTADISYVLGCSDQVVQKRRREYEAKGTITAVKEMSWQKIKPEHRQALTKIVEEHGENKSLKQLAEYMEQATGVRLSTVSISRMLKAQTAVQGQARRKVRAPRGPRTGHSNASPDEEPGDRTAWQPVPPVTSSPSPAGMPHTETPLPWGSLPAGPLLGRPQPGALQIALPQTGGPQPGLPQQQQPPAAPAAPPNETAALQSQVVAQQAIQAIRQQSVQSQQSERDTPMTERSESV